VVVTENEVNVPQLAALQTMHKRIYALDVPWAQHLEGSYVPRKSLRRLDPSRRPYLYLDNGASELVWDNHCNTELVRWSLRECGGDPRGTGTEEPRRAGVCGAASPRGSSGAGRVGRLRARADPRRRDEPVAAAAPRSLLLPGAAHPGDREGHVEARGGGVGPRRAGRRVGESRPTRSRRPAGPVGAGVPAGRAT
jgi:hypothetical protein